MQLFITLQFFLFPCIVISNDPNKFESVNDVDKVYMINIYIQFYILYYYLSLL